MKAEVKKRADQLTHGNDHQCHGPLNGNTSEYLGTNNLHNFSEFLPIQLSALVHIHLIEYFLAIFPCGGAACSWASVRGELQMNHQKSSVQLLLINLARPIGVNRFEGPVRELLEILASCPHVACFLLLCAGRCLLSTRHGGRRYFICIEERGRYITLREFWQYIERR